MISNVLNQWLVAWATCDATSKTEDKIEVQRPREPEYPRNCANTLIAIVLIVGPEWFV